MIVITFVFFDINHGTECLHLICDGIYMAL